MPALHLSPTAWLTSLLCCTFLSAQDLSPPPERGFLGVIPLSPELVGELQLEDQGFIILIVSPKSPARRAGLQPGDRIRRLDSTPIQMAHDVHSLPLRPGQAIELQIEREGESRSLNVTLAAKTTAPDRASFREALEFLTKGTWSRTEESGPAFLAEEARIRWALGEREESRALLSQALDHDPDAVALELQLLDWLSQSGAYQDYRERAERAVRKKPQEPAFHEHAVLSLLGSGDPARAEKAAGEALITLSRRESGGNQDSVSRLILHWVLSRWRQGKPLQAREIEELRASREAFTIDVPYVKFWVDQCGSRPVVSVSSPRPSSTIELRTDAVETDYVVSLRLNGEKFSRFRIDPGAWCTFITPKTADQARVSYDSTAGNAIAGFSTFPARGGVVEELRIGDFSVRNTPVLVSNAYPLLAGQVDGVIGMDLMHHLRFTLDYAHRSAVVSRTGGALPLDDDDQYAPWDIPLWTFPHASLAQATCGEKGTLRVVFHTSSRDGTLVTPAWGQDHLPGYRPPRGLSRFLDAAHPPVYTLRDLELGGLTLPDWPVRLTPYSRPQLARAFDVVFGRELLGQYRVTIDLRRRILRLQHAGEPR